MKTLRTLAASILALSLLLVAVPARATSVTDCLAAIAELRAETDAVQYFSANAAKDESGLLAKLDAASSKLNLAKFADAIQKLNDYESKVQSLIAQGKIGPSPDGLTTPQMLVNGAEAAIACIQQIGQ